MWCILQQTLGRRQTDTLDMLSVHHEANRDTRSPPDVNEEQTQTGQRVAETGTEPVHPVVKRWCTNSQRLHLSSRWQRWSEREEMHDCILDPSAVARVNLLLPQFQFVSIVLPYIHLCVCVCVCARREIKKTQLTSLKINVRLPSALTITDRPAVIHEVSSA